MSPYYLQNKKKEINMRKFLTVLVLLVLSGAVGAVVWVNDICDPFPEETAVKIDDHVSKGSALWFKANADFMYFLAGYEAKEYDVTNGLSLIQSAITRLENAKGKYAAAFTAGSLENLKTDKVDALKKFNYDKFADEHELFKKVTDKVKGFLNTGHPLDFYKAVETELTGVITLMKTIEASLKEGTKPDKVAVWALYQKITEFHLVGNYATVMAQSAFGH